MGYMPEVVLCSPLAPRARYARWPQLRRNWATCRERGVYGVELRRVRHTHSLVLQQKGIHKIVNIFINHHVFCIEEASNESLRLCTHRDIFVL